MTENTERFELKLNGNGQADIIDWVESKEKNAICIYNDLGVLPFSSANQLCELLNNLAEENKQLKSELGEKDIQLDFLKAENKHMSDLVNENKQLKKALDDLEVYDDEEFREAEYINSIYKEGGFNGVIDYAKRRLCQYGLVKEIGDGLWVMVTGGWSDNEFWLDCLNSPVSIFYMKHYCAYETGGAFYYTEKPHDKIEIRLKGDLE